MLTYKSLKPAHVFRLAILAITTFVVGNAHAVLGTQTISVDGKLYSATDLSTSLIDANVAIKFQILDPSKTCVLYEELQSVNTTASAGYFTVQVGSALLDAKRTVADAGNTMAAVFQNQAAIVATGCAGSSYTPTSAQSRYLRIIVTPSSTGLVDTLSPDMILAAVPNAIVAESLQGIDRSQVLQVNTSGGMSLSQANLNSVFTTSNYAALSALLGGTSAQYVQNGANGAGLVPTFSGAPTAPIEGEFWYDTTAHQLKYRDNSGTQIVGSGGGPVSGGAITSGTIGGTTAVNTSGGITSAGTLTGGVLSGTTILAAPGTAALPGYAFTGNINTGIFSPAINQIGLSTNGIERMRVDAAGNIGIGTATPGAPLDVKGAIRMSGSTSGYAGLQPAAAAGSTVWTLPSVDGGTGAVLSTNGLGILSWATPSSGSVSSVVSGTGLVPGTITSSGTINVNTGTGVNQIVQLNGSSQIPAVSGALLTNLNASAVASGTLTIANGGTGITTSPSAGQILVANGTGAWNLFGCSTTGNVLSWTVGTGFNCAAASTGTVTSVAAGAGLTGGVITSTGTLALGLSGVTAGNYGSATATSQVTVDQYGRVTSGTSVAIAGLDGAVITTGTIAAARLPASSSIWSLNGTNAYYNGGNVGIGTTNPAGIFDVRGGTASTGIGGTDININAQNGGSGGAAANGGNVSIAAGAGSAGGTAGSVLLTNPSISGSGQLYFSSSVSAVNPVAATALPSATLRILNQSATDGAETMITFGTVNSGFNLQSAYFGTTAVAGAGNTPAVVIGQQTGINSYKESMRIDSSGNVGVGTTNPRSSLDIAGTITGKPATPNGTATINFATGNLQYTSASCGAFQLNNLKDGGTYSFAIQGTSSATCSFTAFSDSGTTPLTVHLPPAHGSTVAGLQTLYSMMVMGSHLYISWTNGI